MVMCKLLVEEGTAALICSDSFCFFFLADRGSGAELGDNDCEEDDVCSLCKGGAVTDDCGGADDTEDRFVLFFDCGLAVADSLCVSFPSFVVDSVKAVAGRDDDVCLNVMSWWVGGVLELAAALQYGK